MTARVADVRVPADGCGRAVLSHFCQAIRVTGVRGRTGACRVPVHLVFVGVAEASLADGTREAGTFAIPGGLPYELTAAGTTHHLVYLDSRRFVFADVARFAQGLCGRPPEDIEPDELVRDADKLPPRGVPDRRLERALCELQMGASVAQAAQRAGLSVSHLAALSREDTGASPRLWRTWLRLKCAITLMAVGASATQAAHAAGFADAAHLTRTCRSTLGIGPSGVGRTSFTALPG